MSFREHTSWCPDGQPADGTLRLDLFPDWSAFPVWRRGCMVTGEQLGLSEALTQDLKRWEKDWEDNTVIGSDDPPDPAWERRLPELAERLAAETGAVVVCPWAADRRGKDCPRCGTDAMDERLREKLISLGRQLPPDLEEPGA